MAGGFVYPVPALATRRASAAELPVRRAHGYDHARPLSGTPLVGRQGGLRGHGPGSPPRLPATADRR